MQIISLAYNKLNKLIKNTDKSKIIFNSLSKFIWIIFRFVLIVGISFIIIYPILTKLATSFKTYSDMYDPAVFLLPKEATFNNYSRVFEYLDYIKTLVNSFLFTALNSFFQLASCTLVAYGLARFKFKARSLIFGLVIFTLIVPAQTILMPLYLQFRYFSLETLFAIAPNGQGISLLNTYWPMFMMSLTALGFKNGLLIFILRQYFKNMPNALEEAAYIDGCGTFKTFLRIMLPGAVPMLITVFLFSFVWIWNDYFYTAFLTPSMKIMSISIVSVGQKINNLDKDPFNTITTMMYNNSAMMLHMIPLILLYTFTQRYFVESIEKSGIVG